MVVMFNLFGGVFPLKFGKVGSMVHEREGAAEL
jgi:hypothetical protein